jgi:hypothetical protein
MMHENVPNGRSGPVFHAPRLAQLPSLHRQSISPVKSRPVHPQTALPQPPGKKQKFYYLGKPNSSFHRIDRVPQRERAPIQVQQAGSFYGKRFSEDNLISARFGKKRRLGKAPKRASHRSILGGVKTAKLKKLYGSGKQILRRKVDRQREEAQKSAGQAKRAREAASRRNSPFELKTIRKLLNQSSHTAVI